MVKMSYVKPSIKSKHFEDFKNKLPKMYDKTVIITGTTSGTGYVAAKTLAELGARVIMLNRPSSRSLKVHEEILKTHPNSDLTTINCDLQSFKSVSNAINEIKKRFSEGIDVICNNAGVMALKDISTVDGYDIQMQTNHLSHFLLTCELIPLLKKNSILKGESRIVNHSSIARHSVRKLEKIYLEKNGGNLGGNGKSLFFGGARWKRYGQTKLANAAFSAALHNKLKNHRIKSLFAHPGLSNTELQITTLKDGGMPKFFTRKMMKRSQSEEDGAMGIISCICLPNIKSGQFWGPGKGLLAIKGKAKPYDFEKKYNNDRTIDLIWEKSCNAVGKKYNFN